LFPPFGVWTQTRISAANHGLQARGRDDTRVALESERSETGGMDEPGGDFPKMPEAGLLQHLIKEKYTRQDLAAIKQVLDQHKTHEITPVAHGLFAASPSQTDNSLTGYQNVWVRDNIIVANSFRLRGILPPAIACIQGLTQFLERQRVRFEEIISDEKRVLKVDVNRRPHIRFMAATLDELPEKWAHAQNDALGQALWFRFVLANERTLPVTHEDWKIYRLFPAYFEAIAYWNDEDSGAWEEGLKVNNSSVGAVVAGLEELQRYLYSAPAKKELGVKSLTEVDRQKLEDLIAKGRQRLNLTLPFESPPERLADSALLLLIHPLGTVTSRHLQDAILNLVQARLRGDVGIKRYTDDSYFCQDYDEWFAPDQMCVDFSDSLAFRNAFLQPGCEAQWCIFDPLLSIIYGERYFGDRTDSQSLDKQIYYFNRSLRQVTPKGECPELYYFKNGKYTPNAHTPLAWTQANQALALYLMEKSVGE
jgi:GH15 family glucan-1,4-alpha-glucosidase